MTMEALAEDNGYVTHLRDRIQQRRRRGVDDGPKEYMMTTEALKEEDEHRDYNNDNGCVSGGYMTCPRDKRRQRRRQQIDDGPGGLATTTEC